MVCESMMREYIGVGETRTKTGQLPPQKGAWEGTDQLAGSESDARGWGPEAGPRNRVLNTC